MSWLKFRHPLSKDQTWHWRDLGDVPPEDAKHHLNGTWDGEIVDAPPVDVLQQLLVELCAEIAEANVRAARIRELLNRHDRPAEA